MLRILKSSPKPSKLFKKKPILKTVKNKINLKVHRIKKKSKRLNRTQKKRINLKTKNQRTLIKNR